MPKKLTAYAVTMGPAKCAVDIGDGSERGEYVDQDYILNALGRPHRGVSLMTCYYPLDKEFPARAHEAYKDMEIHGAWDYPYDDYETYKGGLVGMKDKEPFNWMEDVRRHGQDVLLTITIDPHVGDDHIKAIAKDLSVYGRVLARINHEATGNWFSFNKRASYEEVSLFYARVCKIFHKEAPNVKLILCLDGYKNLKDEKMEKEDEFIPAIKETDIYSVDRYLALHWGWPFDVAEPGGNSFARYKVQNIYNLAKKSYYRYIELTGKKKPMVLSELNADGDVTGPYDQCKMVKKFTDLIKNDKDRWLSAFTLYQFRDQGRLGLEIEDPNNKNVGIRQPLFDTYRKIIHDEFFMPTMKKGKSVTLPAKLRWGGSEDAEGLLIPLKFDAPPVFCEAYFEDDLKPLNLMIELNGRWFYKAPGTTFVDFMPAFFEKPIKGEAKIDMKIFAPPADGKNDPKQGKDWQTNYYATIPSLPKIRICTTPVAK
jgi:hypothetical protein